MKRRALSAVQLPCLLVALAFGTAVAATPMPPHCPDLSGTYAVGQTEWIDALILRVNGTVRPKTQSPQRATLRPRADGYTLTWHMPRAQVLSAAKRLAEGDPRKYGRWLDMALRDPPAPSSDGGTLQGWVNELAILGPVHRIEVRLPYLQCEGGWYLLGTQGRTGPPDVAGGMDGDRDAQLWLQRKDGALALRWRERRKLVVISPSRYSKEAAVPLWSADHLAQWPAAEAPDLAPLREDELPARNLPPKCRVDIEKENQFFRRMDAILPARTRHANRVPGGLYLGRMRADGTCEPMLYFVRIEAHNAADIDTVEAFLKTDPFIARMESKETEIISDGRHTAVFRMVHVP